MGKTKSMAGVENADMVRAEQDLVIDAQFLIQDALNERELTRAELARLTGVSKARLSQLMKAEANPTLRTVARIFCSMGEGVTMQRKKAHAVSSDVWSERFEESRFENDAQLATMLEHARWAMCDDVFVTCNDNYSSEDDADADFAAAA